MPDTVQDFMHLKTDMRPDIEAVPALSVFEFDLLDVVMLNKFLANHSYSVQNLLYELVQEKKTNIGIVGIRHRLERKFVPMKLVFRIKTFGIIYDLNPAAQGPIRDLTQKFTAFVSASKII